jgi:hypothetical protein
MCSQPQTRIIEGKAGTTFVPAFSLLWFAVSRKFVLRVSPPAAPRAHADFLNELVDAG